MAAANRTCTFPDCAKPYHARGLCTGHYQQVRKGMPLDVLQSRLQGHTVAERLAAYTDTTGDCWLWTSEINENGYGLININGLPRRVHRVAYELANGPIPPGVEIDHRCFVHACLRPSHLQPPTHKQNGENRAGPPSNNTSGVRGVYWYASRQKWHASVGHNGRKYHAGYFTTIEEAEAAVIVKRLELHTNNLLDQDAVVGGHYAPGRA